MKLWYLKTKTLVVLVVVLINSRQMDEVICLNTGLVLVLMMC